MRMTGHLHFFPTLLAALCTFSATSPGQTSPPKDLDKYVERVQEQFNVPGIALAIVKDGRVVVTTGYGVRTLGGSDQVDKQTLFGIASNTKAFTATALAILVEEGKIEWDAPVIRFLPWFRLSNPYVTQELTIRDLLVHRSGLGLGAGDLLWWPPSTYSRREIAERLAHIPLKSSFRSRYAYDNVLYTVAGEVIEAVSGKTWEEFVQMRILDAIGMTGSTVRHSDAGKGGNSATPHGVIDGKVSIVKPFSSDLTNPAGGINSSAEDMAKWLLTQLDSGRVAGGKRLYSPKTTRQLWGIVTPIPFGDPPPELAPARLEFDGYALGFEVRDYRRTKIITHTGGLPGYVSRVTLVPSLKLGIAVLTNQEAGEAFQSITNHILDTYLDSPAFDWISAFRKVAARRDSANATADSKIRSLRDSTAGPSLPLRKYAGTYRDAWYGDIQISHENEKLSIRFTKTPALEGDLVHWQYDTFVARWYDRELRADAFMTFSLNPDGSIERAKMRAVSPTTDFSYDFQDLLFVKTQ
jgi:CubicO group peptidase (beta-lactamase class C family)